MTAGPGTDQPNEPSAEEMKQRLDELGEEVNRGSGEGTPDPETDA